MKCCRGMVALQAMGQALCSLNLGFYGDQRPTKNCSRGTVGEAETKNDVRTWTILIPP